MVFKASDIGVFDNWVEAAGAVLGVKGGIYNGFYSQAQAEREFEAALEDRFVDVLVWK